MKRALSLLLVIISIFGLFSACSSDEPVVLFFAVDEGAGSFDPQIVSDTTASIVVRNCFEGLLRKDENGEIINGVAKDYKVSSDGLRYTFYLREDAVWHLTSNAKKQLEGKIPEDMDLSVTAYDFQFALSRAVNPETMAHASYMLYNIENAPEILAGEKSPDELGVKAVDKYTLEITLSKPQSNFPEVLCEPVAMPCNETFFNACSGRYGTLIAFSLSNGPFYLSRFDDTSYRINKAADYVGESTAVPDYVWLYVVKNEERLIEVLETNDYSGAVIDEEVYKKLKVGRKMTVKETPNVVSGFIMNISDEIMSEQYIRKAIAAATDTEEVAKNMGGIYHNSLIPLSASDGSVLTHPEPYSEEKAAVYLKSGLQKLERSTVDISVLCDKRYEGTVRRVMQEWQRILGISVNFTVKSMDAADAAKNIARGNFQIALSGFLSQSDSIYEYFGTFTKNSPYNFTGYEGFGMEELISKLYSGDESTFRSVYASLESKLSAEALVIPVCSGNSYFVCTEDVRDVIYFDGKDKLYFHKATNE